MARTVMGEAESKGLTASWHHIQLTDAGFGGVNRYVQRVSTHEG